MPQEVQRQSKMMSTKKQRRELGKEEEWVNTTEVDVLFRDQKADLI